MPTGSGGFTVSRETIDTPSSSVLVHGGTCHHRTNGRCFTWNTPHRLQAGGADPISRWNTDTEAELGSRLAPEITTPSHRSPLGGSLMTTNPRWRTQPSAVVNVWTGGPKPRATTASNGLPVTLCASPVRTSTRSCHPRRRTTRARKSVRVRRRSSRVTFHVGWIVGDHESGHAASGTEIEHRSGHVEFSPASSRTPGRARSPARSDGAPRNPSCCDRRSTSSEFVATTRGQTTAPTSLIRQARR